MPAEQVAEAALVPGQQHPVQQGRKQLVQFLADLPVHDSVLRHQAIFLRARRPSAGAVRFAWKLTPSSDRLTTSYLNAPQEPLIPEEEEVADPAAVRAPLG